MKRKVLACIDASPYADVVSDYAIWAAAKLDVAMLLVHALDKAQHTQTPDLSGSIGLGSQELLLQQLAELDEKHGKLALEQGRQLLDTAKLRVEHAGVSAVAKHLRHGSLLETLTELEEQTRLIVIGKRGVSSTDAHGQMGQHVERLIRNVQKPILLTQQAYAEPKRIMFAYDGSATALKSLEMLAASPLVRGLPIHLVIAGAEDDATRMQLSSAAALLKTAGFDLKTAIVEGEPQTVLQQYQQDHLIDLMVMGAYGHSRIRQFILGSTTTAMICNVKCALLILR